QPAQNPATALAEATSGGEDLMTQSMMGSAAMQRSGMTQSTSSTGLKSRLLGALGMGGNGEPPRQ
ncbi:hypothetical protein AAVH_35501, partial [Aphelenchoides avenae]